MKRFLGLIGSLLLASLPLWGSQAERHKDSLKVAAAVTAERIVADAKTHIGQRYRYGAMGPDSFDCSGFTSYLYKPYGYTLSRSSKGQSENGEKVRRIKDLQKGDLVLFGGRKDKKHVGHVGIFIEAEDDGDSFTFIHASNHGVMISHLKEAYYSERYLGARRILADFDKMNQREIHLLEAELAQLGIDARGYIPVEERPEIPAIDSTALPRRVEVDLTAPARYHTVRTGDSLASIAEKRHTSVEALCVLNSLFPDSPLEPGQRIRVR